MCFFFWVMSPALVLVCVVIGTDGPKGVSDFGAPVERLYDM